MRREDAIQVAAEEVLAARDFNGNEHAAVREVQDDLSILFTPGELGEIARRVRSEWERCQDMAGVSPEQQLSQSEHRRIAKAMEP